MLAKRLIVLVEPKNGWARQNFFPALCAGRVPSTFKFVPVSPASLFLRKVGITQAMKRLAESTLLIANRCSSTCSCVLFNTTVRNRGQPRGIIAQAEAAATPRASPAASLYQRPGVTIARQLAEKIRDNRTARVTLKMDWTGAVHTLLSLSWLSRFRREKFFLALRFDAKKSEARRWLFIRSAAKARFRVHT